MLRRRLTESLLVTLVATGLTQMMSVGRGIPLVAGLLIALEFWPIMDWLVDHRRRPWVFRSSAIEDSTDEAFVDYIFYRSIAHEDDSLLRRAAALRDSVSVVANHSLLGALLHRVEDDLARAVAGRCIGVAGGAAAVALSYYWSSPDLFVESRAELAFTNALVAAALVTWFIAAVLVAGNPRSPVLILASVTLSASILDVVNVVGLHDMAELQTLSYGVYMYVAGLLLFHLGGVLGSGLLRRLAAAVIGAGATWIAMIEFYNAVVIREASPLYNFGVLVVGVICAQLAVAMARMSGRRPPAAIAES